MAGVAGAKARVRKRHFARGQGLPYPEEARAVGGPGQRRRASSEAKGPSGHEQLNSPLVVETEVLTSGPKLGVLSLELMTEGNSKSDL